LKTCQDYVQSTLDGSLEEYSGTFPRQGLMRSGRLYLLPTSGRRTSESESSLWPTVTAQDAKNDAGPSQWERNSDPLNVAVKRWPSPTAMDVMETDGTPRPSRIATNRKTEYLARQVHWPTPQEDDSSNVNPNEKRRDTLAKVVGTGQLNPTWVEWLMGFPLGWTDLGDSATPSSRRSRK
jgi:hypothetical protein